MTRAGLWALLAALLALALPGGVQAGGSPEEDREHAIGAGRGRRTGTWGWFGVRGAHCLSFPTPVLPRSLGTPSACAGKILVKFRDSITNWDAVKQGGNLEGWDDTLPTYLWTGVVLDFDLRVREV